MRITIVGCGGNGGWTTLMASVAMPAATFTLIDDDTFESHNTAQFAFRLGATKSRAVTSALRRLYPAHKYRVRVTRVARARDIPRSDVIVSCPDNHACRAICYQAARKRRIPYITTGVLGYRGDTLLWLPNDPDISERFVLAELGRSCAPETVLGNLMCASQVTWYLAHLEDVPRRELLFEGPEARFRV